MSAERPVIEDQVDPASRREIHVKKLGNWVFKMTEGSYFDAYSTSVDASGSLIPSIGSFRQPGPPESYGKLRQLRIEGCLGFGQPFWRVHGLII